MQRPEIEPSRLDLLEALGRSFRLRFAKRVVAGGVISTGSSWAWRLPALRAQRVHREARREVVRVPPAGAYACAPAPARYMPLPRLGGSARSGTVYSSSAGSLPR